jgi:hypothetical protein
VGSGAPPARLGALAVCAVALVVLAIAPGSASAAAQTFCPPGTDAGQCNDPQSLAVDQTTGTVYIAESNNYRVSEFDSSGHFIRAFGVGVFNGANELQTCTSICRAGLEGVIVPGTMTPVAVAVDQSSHEIYVVDEHAHRVEKFTPAGEFVLMFGKGVDQGGGFPSHPGDVCTAEYISNGDKCGAGAAGSAPGAINGLPALALDPSHNVWVGDNERLERFSPAGVFLSELILPGAGKLGALAIDTDVSSPSFGDFYTLKPFSAAQNEVQGITPSETGKYTLTFGGQTTRSLEAGASPGEVQEALEELSSIGAHNVQVDSAGSNLLYRVVEFTGAFAATNVEQITASGAATVETAQQGRPEAPAVLSKLKPNGELVETLDASGHPFALGLDPASGDLFVSDLRGEVLGNATLLEYGPSGVQLEAFGFGEVIGHPQGDALAFGNAGHLYVVSSASENNSAAQIFTLPPPGPLPGAGSAKANEIKKTAATLCTGINPEGKETTFRFQYIAEAKFKEDGNGFGAGTLETVESGSVGADFAAHEACEAVSGLVPATGYRFRLVASNENAPLPGDVDGETAEFTTLPPALIDSSTVSAVTAESATLQAEINPLGDLTSYHFEYLTEAAYLQNEEAGEPLFTGAVQVPSADAPVGAGFSDVSVSQHLQGLASHTTYRYRTVVENAVSEAFGGPFAGPVHAFTTQAPVSLALPDGRGWELVSPLDKRGGLIGTLQYGQIQTAADGGAFAFVSSTPTEGDPPGSNLWNQVLAVRGGVGSSSWSDRTIDSPHQEATGLETGTSGEYVLFSSDLSQAALQPEGPFDPELSAEASEQTAYMRTNFLHGNRAEACLVSCYRPLVTGNEGFANVPSGTVIDKPVGEGPRFRGATPDLSHVVIEGATALTVTSLPHFGLYEWSAAASAAEQLRLITVLPSGQAAPGQPGLGWSPGLGRSPVARNAISADGSRVVWSGSEGNAHLYLRYNATEEQSSVAGGKCSEPGRACTIQLDSVQGGSGLGEAQPHFQAASVDDSAVFFTDTQNLTVGSGAQPGRPDLYRCQVVVAAGGGAECRLSDLTPPGPGGEPAAVLGTVPGASADGSYVYFVANGVLASGGSPGDCSFSAGTGSGSCNLYLDHEGTTIFLASLAGADYPSWSGTASGNGLAGLTSRVSPNGRWLAFMSERPLTGYDSRDARTGRPDEEVFLYHAGAGAGGEGKLVCASCNPTGARPRGEEYAAVSHSGVDGSSPWPEGQGIAASVPSWMEYQLYTALYQPRYLSDSGRLFFNSDDALVSTDTNGAGDVYQYEPPQGAEAPPGDTCNSEAPTYSPAAGGCIDLISSGTSAEESGFLDASENGEDVFFFTDARLSPADVDSSRDVYDAHVCSAEYRCPPPPPPPPPACQGDACQSPVQAPDDPTPGSLTFSGPGNPVGGRELNSTPPVKKKTTKKTVKCKKPKKLSHGKCVKSKKKAKKAKQASYNRRASR